MWLIKQDEEHIAEVDMEEQQIPDQSLFDMTGKKPQSEGNKDSDRDLRRSRRKSLSLADRMRRGMTGEMTVDLQTLVSRAKPVVAKSFEVSGGESVDIVPILAWFLEVRVAPS